MGIVEECIIGKDSHVRGAKVRISGKGKNETINRPLQRLFPLEIAAKRDCRERKNGKKCSKESETEGKDLSVNEGSTRNPGRALSTRAAAVDARLRTQVMLDLI